MLRIKQMRRLNRWTQQYVADEIGIAKSSYSNIETMRRIPSLKVALKLQEMFETPIEILLEKLE